MAIAPGLNCLASPTSNAGAEYTSYVLLELTYLDVELSVTRQCCTDIPSMVLSGCTRCAETSNDVYVIPCVTPLGRRITQYFFRLGSMRYVVSLPFLPSEYVPGTMSGGLSLVGSTGGFAAPVGRTSDRARPLLLICILLDMKTDGLGSSVDVDVTVTVIVRPPLCSRRADEGGMASARRAGAANAARRRWCIIVGLLGLLDCVHGGRE